METTPEQLAARLGKGPLAPAYLVAGPELLRVLEGADAVRAAARTQGISEREVFQAEGNQRVHAVASFTRDSNTKTGFARLFPSISSLFVEYIDDNTPS